MNRPCVIPADLPAQQHDAGKSFTQRSGGQRTTRFLRFRLRGFAEALFQALEPPIQSSLLRGFDLVTQFADKLLLAPQQQKIELPRLREIAAERLEQRQLHVGVAQLVERVEAFLEDLPRLLQRIAQAQRFQQVEHRQQAARLDPQLVHGALRKFFLAARQPFAVAAAHFPDAVGQVPGEGG